MHKLTKTIRSKIFNHKKIFQTLDIDLILQDRTIIPCNCHLSEFKDPDHGHIITGDLRIVQNNKLRKLLSKGPKYREPVSINWNNCKTELKKAVLNCIKQWSCREGINESVFTEWLNNIIVEIDSKIDELKQRIHPKIICPVLNITEVNTYLIDLQDEYVMVPIDKAANNVAFICKRYYVEVLLQELGLINVHSQTYKVINDVTIPEVINQQINELLTSFKIKVELEEMKVLPCIYWLPKMHKKPSAARFIIAGKRCTTKLLSKHVTSVFKFFFDQIERYHKKVHYFSGVKTFWVIQNNEQPLESMARISERTNAKRITTFDFSTLYTKLPHNQLIMVMNKIIEFVFKGGTRDVVAINNRGVATWSSKRRNTCYYFTKQSIVKAVRYLINNSFFTLGKKLFKQTIGIPMGSDPAPFFANLFLFYHEEQWISKQRKANNNIARKFGNTSRFIDDLVVLNDSGTFEQNYQEIYPKELELKKENLNINQATFLDIDIKIENGKFITKLYDKRNTFGFNITRMPFKNSNIPSKMFYSSIGAEFLRMARVTSKIEDLKISCSQLISRMTKQRGVYQRMLRVISKMINRHPMVFEKYNLNTHEIIAQVGI